MQRLAGALLVLLLLGAASWGLAERRTPTRATGAAQVRLDSDVGAVRMPAATRAPRRCDPGRVLGATHGARAEAALVVRPTVARRAPFGRRIARFGLRNVNGVQTVFGVLGRRVDASCRPTWYRVQLPLRPNGSTGWVRAADVRRFTVGSRVLVDLSERTVTLYRLGRVVLRVPAAVGKPLTPTPTGRFYVNQRLLAENPDGVFGPGGVGISAFSPTLRRWAQGGPIAIHGTDRPDLIGQEVSHGCVRIRNDALRTLLRLAPEGTPVEIRA